MIKSGRRCKLSVRWSQVSALQALTHEKVVSGRASGVKSVPDPPCGSACCDDTLGTNESTWRVSLTTLYSKNRDTKLLLESVTQDKKKKDLTKKLKVVAVFLYTSTEF